MLIYSIINNKEMIATRVSVSVCISANFNLINVCSRVSSISLLADFSKRGIN